MSRRHSAGLTLAAALCCFNVSAEEFPWCPGTEPSPKPLPSSTSRPGPTFDLVVPTAISEFDQEALRDFARSSGRVSGGRGTGSHGGNSMQSSGLDRLSALPGSLQIPRNLSNIDLANLAITGVRAPLLLPPGAAGLSPSSKTLSEDIAAAFPQTGLSTVKLAKAKELLGTLPLKQQARIVSIARQRFDGPLATTREADAQNSAEHLARLTRAFNLQQSFDPNLAEAMFHGKLEDKSDDALIKIAERKDVLNLGAQVERFTTVAKNKGWLKGQHTVDIVGPGEGAPPGSLGDVPPGMGVRIVNSDEGNWCKRPTVTSDFLLDPKSKMVGQNWDPIAFADVAMLLMRKTGSGAAGTSICTAVRVSSGHLLTAAHCLATKGQSAKWEKKNFDDAAFEAIALLPKLSTKAQKPEQCFDAPTTCGFHVAKVTGSGRFPTSINWVGDVPSPDIGLLTVLFPAASGNAVTVAVGEEPNLQQLTLAGYGLTNAGGPTYSGYLQVGWQRRAAQLDGGVLVWAVDLDGGFAGACNGDSGGAIFDGVVSHKKDARRLAGLISYGYGASSVDGIERCLKMSNGVATRLSQHAKWICESTSGTALGCSQ